MGAQVSRRRLLEGSAALVPGPAILAMGRSAGAFSTETMRAGSGVGPAYASRFGGDSIHPMIIAQLQADLASRSGPPPVRCSRSQRVCPICGCAITVTRTIR